jgi:hypothetical protein
MRKLFVAALSVILCAAAVAAQGSRQIQIFASVLDGTGAPAKALAVDDVRLTENGMEAKITKVEPVNWPVKLQILLDNGVGIGSQNIQQLKNGVMALLEAMPANLEITMVATAPQPRFVVKPTTDKAAALKGLELLAPDSGAGRFLESLNEATQRIEKDKGDYFPVIISVATTAGDRDVRDSDVERMMKRLEARPTTVHVLLYNGGSQSSSGGANQTNIGMNVTKYTGGKFENINSATRIAPLLSEWGKTVATAVERQSHQFRITSDRPAGASGDIGKISAGAKSPLSLASLSFDGRVR